MFAVHKLCQYVAQPRQSHLIAPHTLLRYLKGIPKQGLFRLELLMMLIWALVLILVSPQWVPVIYLGDSSVSQKSKKQATVSICSTKAEYRTLATFVNEVSQIAQLLKDLQVTIQAPPLLFCDSSVTIHIASNPVFYEKTKHIELDCHLIQDHVTKADIEAYDHSK